MSDDTEKAMDELEEELYEEVCFINDLKFIMSSYPLVSPDRKCRSLDNAIKQCMNRAGLAVDATEQPATKGVIH